MGCRDQFQSSKEKRHQLCRWIAWIISGCPWMWDHFQSPMDSMNHFWSPTHGCQIIFSCHMDGMNCFWWPVDVSAVIHFGGRSVKQRLCLGKASGQNLKWQWWQASEVGLWFMKYLRLWFGYFCCLLLRYYLVHSYSQLVKFNWF